MNKPPQFFAKPLFALLGAAIAATSAFAQMSANSNEVTSGQTLTLTLNQASARSESVYFAILFGGSTYFVGENGSLSVYQPGTVTPHRLSNAAQGTHTLFSFTIPAGLAGKADFYSALGQSGVDVLGTPGALDMSSLQHVGVTLKAAMETPDGKALYKEHCAACHGVNPAYNVDRILLGRDAGKIRQAINLDKGGKGYLSFLTDAQLAAIAAWISNPI